MNKKQNNLLAGLGLIATSLILVGCGFGEPSTADIQSSLRQVLLVEAKQGGEPP